MSRKLSLTAQWMLDHPDDEPCPPGSDYMAVRWRRERGLVDRRPKAVRDRRRLWGGPASARRGGRTDGPRGDERGRERGGGRGRGPWSRPA
jgi:hypothetical protein